jgi:hypothetical protein
MIPTRAAALVVAIVVVAWVKNVRLLLLLMMMTLMMTTVMTVMAVFISVKQVGTITANAIPWSPRGLWIVGHAVVVLVAVTTRMTAFHGRIVASCHGTRGARIAIGSTKLIGRRRQIIRIILRHYSVDSSLAL